MIVLVVGTTHNLKHDIYVRWRIWVAADHRYYYDLQTWSGQPDGSARGPNETLTGAFLNLYKECIMVKNPALYQ